MAILFALSFSHMINDILQSLVPAIYPLLKTAFALSYHADRSHHADEPVDRLAPATAGRLLYGPLSEALFARHRHGLDAHRHGAARPGRQLRDDPHRGRVRRRRLVGLSSGGLARRAPGLGRTAWLRAIALSSRRECGHVVRAASGRAPHRALWATGGHLVLTRRADRHRRADPSGPLVSCADRRAQERGQEQREHYRAYAATGLPRAGHPRSCSSSRNIFISPA